MYNKRGNTVLSRFGGEREKGKMALVNTMEQVVDFQISELLPQSDCCRCEQCREDIMCLALNALPSKYVSTAKGELYSKLSQAMIKQHSIDVNIACVNAIEFVKTHPKHDAR